MSSNTQQPSIPPVPQDGGDFPLVDLHLAILNEALQQSIKNPSATIFIALKLDTCRVCGDHETVVGFVAAEATHAAAMSIDPYHIIAILHGGRFVKEPPGWAEHKLRFYASNGEVH
jgi:hypothetical protein